MSLSSPVSTSVTAPRSASTTAASSQRAGAGAETFYRRQVFRAFTPMTRGLLRVQLPEGTWLEFGSPAEAADTNLPLGIAPAARLRIRNEQFFERCFWSGDIGFAEAYIHGDWDTDDLTAVIAWFIRNVEHAPTLSGSNRPRQWSLNLLRVIDRTAHLLRPNTRTIARRNIGEHYDLSNELFALFLDPSMMYSSALWPAHAPELSLEQAQREKNDALCRRLRLKPSDHVLEIGTGWGGWALHAASNYGCRVTTVTISRQQFEFARQRIEAAGLSHRVDVQFCDFRDVVGQFDKIVSIEMVEALGHRFQPVFAGAVARLLKPDGLVALQFITCPDHRYAAFRRGVDFIQKHIFPGSLLLSLNRMNDLLARSGGFVLHELSDFGPDYARTLRIWQNTFRAKLDRVRALGFDEAFIRKWTYYLSYCEAAFALRNISVVHTVHTRANNLSL